MFFGNGQSFYPLSFYFSFLPILFVLFYIVISFIEEFIALNSIFCLAICASLSSSSLSLCSWRFFSHSVSIITSNSVMISHWMILSSILLIFVRVSSLLSDDYWLCPQFWLKFSKCMYVWSCYLFPPLEIFPDLLQLYWQYDGYHKSCSLSYYYQITCWVWTWAVLISV